MELDPTVSTWATIAAAVATAASALFVGLQALQTRKSVRATGEALEVARAELEHSQVLRSDSLRAAIDAEMPRLTVTVSAQPRVVRRTDEVAIDARGGYEDHKPLGAGSVVASNDPPGLSVLVGVRVANDGPRQALLEVEAHGTSFRLPVAANGVESFRAVVELSPEEWGAITTGASHSEQEAARLIYKYPGDIGADELHRVLLSGSAVEAIEDDSRAWLVRDLEDESTVVAHVEPFTRDYWSSRKKERMLDVPPGAV